MKTDNLDALAPARRVRHHPRGAIICAIAISPSISSVAALSAARIVARRAADRRGRSRIS